MYSVVSFETVFARGRSSILAFVHLVAGRRGRRASGRGGGSARTLPYSVCTIRSLFRKRLHFASFSHPRCTSSNSSQTRATHNKLQPTAVRSTVSTKCANITDISRCEFHFRCHRTVVSIQSPWLLQSVAKMLLLTSFTVAK